MKQSNANRKTNEQAREILASLLLFEVSDPRLHMVTITGCEVSYDRSYCNVYYTAQPGAYDDAAEGFKAAAGRLRSLMGRRLSWRVTPELRFLLDPSVDEAERIARVLATEARRVEENPVGPYNPDNYASEPVDDDDDFDFDDDDEEDDWDDEIDDEYDDFDDEDEYGDEEDED